MTETVDATEQAGERIERREPCRCEQYARVTEAAALAGARWLGRADQEAAERDAAKAMCDALAEMPVEGNIVIGSAASASCASSSCR